MTEKEGKTTDQNVNTSVWIHLQSQKFGSFVTVMCSHRGLLRNGSNLRIISLQSRTVEENTKEKYY